MTFDLEKMLESKRALRRDFAARPLAEKLAILDALRERSLALRAAAPLVADFEEQPSSSAVNRS